MEFEKSSIRSARLGRWRAVPILGKSNRGAAIIADLRARGSVIHRRPLRSVRRAARPVLAPILVIAAMVMVSVPVAAQTYGWGGGGSGCVNSGCTTAFAVALPVPAVLTPTSTDATTDYYTLTERTANASIIPGKTTPVWAYNGVDNGNYLGPTIKATSGRQVKIHMVNNLTESTTLHLHGAHVASTSDGGPMDLVAPGGSRDYTYPNNQSARTQWYHDHAMDNTATHVYKGMAGMYLISDPQEAALNLPSGPNDVPLVLQDRQFNSDGTLAYSLDSSSIRGGFMGDTQLVNGAPQPYLKVGTRKMRFRVLNGSNARYYTLKLSNSQPIIQIGNESGLRSAPLSLTSITLAPAERADIVIDFSKLAVGTSVTLQNGSGYNSADLMRFDVNTAVTDTSTVPATLRPFTALNPADSTVNRTFTIAQNNGTWTFNNQVYGMTRIDADVKLGATETWTFDNRSGQDHPIHLHDINFQVLSIGRGAPPANANQWKETVNVPAWSSAKILIKFVDFTGTYVFHCHILEHEDKGLMGQFRVSS